jgi:hypothetical protein
MRTILAVLSLILLGGAAPLKAASLETYLPLREGLTLEFRQKFLAPGEQKPRAEARAIRKNLAPTELRGQKVHPQVYIFYPPDPGQSQETTSFIASDDQGFYVLARKTSKDRELQFLPEKFYILKLPLMKGTSWKQRAEGNILHQVIQETGVQVTVPAGTFTDCLLVKRSVFASEGDQTPTSELWLWYAPHVGNVKVLTKVTDPKGELLQELVSFTPK